MLTKNNRQLKSNISFFWFCQLIASTSWMASVFVYGSFTPGGDDLFLHISALREANIDDIAEGESVSYEVGENRGKPIATDIKKL